MNHKHINSTLAILLQVTMTAVLWGCSKEKLTADIAPGQYELLLTVTDGGYTPGDIPNPQTRATDDGYKTTFTEYDNIGLYAVDKNGLLVIKNADLRLNETNGELKWTPIAGGKLTVGNAERFFVYYPYNSSLPTVNTSATTADEFFSDMISKWSPTRGQEGYYTSSDLMVGMGTPGTPADGVCPLSVQLAHKMALIVISPPKTKYTLSSDNSYTWMADDAYLTYDDSYNSFCYMKDGTYRYLVKPGVETRLSGTYVNHDGETRKFALTATIPAGGCKTFTIDGGKTTEKNYTIQTGDYYMSDGSLVSKDKKLNDRLKKTCIGIVAKVGKDENDNCNYMLKGTSTTMTNFHGYVLALKDANYGSTCSWGAKSVATTNVGTDADLASFSGYANTQTIISYVKDKNLSLYSDANATYRATENYEDNYAAPANTSGWFLPSAGQCNWWAAHEAELLSGIEKAGGDKWGTNNKYWSSTENENEVTQAYTCSYSSKALSSSGKKYNYYIRSWLAF